jgi:peptidoglycan/xylan/chitin deacetylase (PgdA/CDA1 family)
LVARLSLPLAAAFVLVPAATAAAAPDLTLTATHARATFLRAQAPNTTVYPGRLTLKVTNSGTEPTDGTTVTLTQPLPAGLTAMVNHPGFGAGPTAASGEGWTCIGGTPLRCTRSDVLAPGDSYPEVTVTVAVSSNAQALLRSQPTVVGGGDTTTFTALDEIPVAADACPNGWAPGPLNPERADGCSLLDLVWAAEPFADRDAFAAKVAEVGAELGLSDAEQAAIVASVRDVGGPDNSCNARVALTFDDGPSSFRPQTLAHLREKGVPATFFDLGMRLEANPQLPRFELADGHVVLGHSYDHPNLNNIPASSLEFEITGTAALFAAHGAPYSFNVIRPPFLSVNANTTAALAAMGFAVTPNPINASDWEPARTAAQIRDGIVNALRPGVAILLHDGPVDQIGGQATVDAVPQIIDSARSRGYCFGTIDHTGQVVADRYESSGEPIPQVSAPVPYIPLATAGSPPDPWVLVPQPLQIEPSHAPSVFVRGETGTLTLTVHNPTDKPTDGSATTVTHPLPAGLTSLGASGAGWACTGTNTVTCTRADVLPAGGAFPPITINVRVAANAPTVITTAPRVTGHSGNVWIGTASDRIPTATPIAGEVSGSVPATLSLSLGAPASFGAFTPGVAREYTASTTATVISSAGDAALSVSDPGDVPGRLVNGAFALQQPVRVAGVPVSAEPALIRAWAAPTANEVVQLELAQAISATEPLRSGTYAKTFVFTLSTTAP